MTWSAHCCRCSTTSTPHASTATCRTAPFASIAAKLEELLGKQGVERFGEVGDAFDPNIHEAVLQQPTDEVSEDHVSMVLRYGYRVNDRVVRTAQVAVAVAP